MLKIRKPNKRKKGLKVLVFGDTGTGKTQFALSFPKSLAVDSEDGYSWYEGTDKAKNLLGIVDTQSYDDVEELLDDLSQDHEAYDTLIIDSETKVYENMQEALLGVEETRAARKGKDVLDANISQRGWGKIKQFNNRIQNKKLRLASQGVTLVSVAQSSDITEDMGGGNRVKVGEKANVHKSLPYDYDVRIRLFVEDGKYFGEIMKDRTGVTNLGDKIENPSYAIWESLVEGDGNRGEVVSKDYTDDTKKSSQAYEEEITKSMSFSDKVKDYVVGLNVDAQKEFALTLKKLVGTSKVAEIKGAEDQKKVLELIAQGD